MNPVFLSASLPLTKSFVLRNGVFAATPYPLVSRVTSHHETAPNMQVFHNLLVKHAALGHCLLGGQLTNPLVGESRAGKSLKSPHEWVVFDFDKVNAKTHAEVVKNYLPPECQGVAYIAQLSASMFRPDNTKWSGHIFMQLKNPVEEQRLKQWFESLNFNMPALESQITLSDSLQALHWPLDRTGAYASKLIYIAPPKCHGFTPAFESHIVYIKGKQQSLTLPNFTPIDSTDIRRKINDLRRAIGLDEIEYSVSTFNGDEVLKDGKLCTIDGIKNSGDHYITFNLNGGDSRAYYIDLRNPHLIRNFKGEPFLKTEDVVPDLFKSICASARKATSKPPLDEGGDAFAFYATNKNSAITIGQYSPSRQQLRLDAASDTSAKAWLFEHGVVHKGFLPHIDLVFDPKSDVQYISGAPYINLFQATKYMTRTRTKKTNSSLQDLPPVIGRLIRHMLAAKDDALVSHFINWLAYVYQTREKTGTAWIMHGVEGTGKGAFANLVLKPLFGQEQVSMHQYAQLQSNFNAFLENKLFVVFDEADIHAVDNENEIMSKLQHYITEPRIEINQKGVKTYQIDNHCNFIFYSNERAPVKMKAGQRRMHTAERQNEKIILTPNDLRTLTEGAELDDFADVLQRWPLVVEDVTRILHTEAADNMHEASTSVNLLIAEAIQRGDLQFFLDRMPSDAEANADFFNKMNPLGLYKSLMQRFTDASHAGKMVVATDEDLFVLFRTLIPDSRYFQDGKTWRKRHYRTLGLDVDRQHRDPLDTSKRVRGVLVSWTKPTEPMMPVDKPVDNVTPMRGKRK